MGSVNKSEKAQQNIKTRVSGKRRAGCSSRSSWSLCLAAASRPRSMRSLLMSSVTSRNAERVRHPAPDGHSGLQWVTYPATEGRSSSLLHVFKEWLAGSPTRSGWPLRVVLCRAGALGRCESPLWYSTRPMIIIHPLFGPQCLQTPPKTPKDTPTPNKDLCMQMKPKDA